MTTDTHSRRKLYLSVLILLIVTSAGVSYPVAQLRLRAVSLLLRIQGQKTGMAIYGTHPVDEIATTIPGPEGPVAARLYQPRGVSKAPGMVVVHGVHHLSIDEPRLVNFARSIAASGIVVVTPALKSLADYHVDERDVAVIGSTAHMLQQQVGQKVGVLGLSFAGGLSLLAAADPQYAGDIGFVTSIGGHDDLQRVCRFYATDEITRPDGSMERLAAHEYGVLVLVYAHVEDFFAPSDIEVARETIRLQLWEKMDEARTHSKQLSPASQARMQLLLEHRKDALAPELLAHLAAHAAEMARVSPHGRLSAIRVPVLLLHGTGDTVIPASEAQWLSREIAPQYLREALISPLITHVEVGGEPGIREKAALVEFMATMLSESDRLRP